MLLFSRICLIFGVIKYPIIILNCLPSKLLHFSKNPIIALLVILVLASPIIINSSLFFLALPYILTSIYFPFIFIKSLLKGSVISKPYLSFISFGNVLIALSSSKYPKLSVKTPTCFLVCSFLFSAFSNAKMSLSSLSFVFSIACHILLNCSSLDFLSSSIACHIL